MQAVDPGHPALSQDLALIRQAAGEAGRIAMRFFGNSPETWMKGGSSPVCEADLAVDRFLADMLQAARPHYGWLSEETTDAPDRLGARRTFVVDPIDGTRGFLEGRRTWCVSIAVVEDGIPLAGVLECPATGELYEAAAGAGAFMNGRRVGVRAHGRSAAIGGPRSMITAARKRVDAAIEPVAHVPSLAYRVAMVAKGDIDATFVKPNAHDWDLAAADLILREAGGRIVNRHRRMPAYAGADPRHGALVAGSGRLLDTLAPILDTQSH